MRLPTAKTILFFAAWGGLPFGMMQANATVENQVELLPRLAQADQWTTKGDGQEVFAVSSVQDFLRVQFSDQQGKGCRLMLAEPVPIPDWATDLTCLNINHRIAGLAQGVQLIVRDAANQEFLFDVASPRFGQKGGLGGDPDLVRLHTPGLTDASMTGATVTITPPAGVKTAPVRPFVLTGLLFKELKRYPGITGDDDLFFHDFTFTGLIPNQSKFYYQLKAAPFYGEIDPTPWISLGDFGVPTGKMLRVSWELRDRYEGNPILAGGKDYALDPAVPPPMQLAQRIEFPVMEKGTYWIHVRVATFRDDSGVPAKIQEQDYRLYVARGGNPTPHPVLAASETIPNALVRIAPGRQILIYAQSDKPVVAVVFDRPDGVTGPLDCHLQLVVSSIDQSVREISVPAKWEEGKPFLVELPLQDIPPGAYLLKAALLKGTRPVDAVERWIGITGSEQETPLGEQAAGIITARDLYARATPMFHLGAEVPDLETIHQYNPGKTKWDFIRPFFDQAPAVSREMEYHVRWREVEPLPGVYDWGEIDRLLQMAQEKGMHVLLSPDIHTKQPDWLPSIFREKRDGGFTLPRSNSSYFNDALFNWESSAELQKPLLKFLQAIATRYRNNPAVEGYSMFLEFCGTVPSSWNWYDGYDALTEADFQAWCQGKFSDLDALNRRWGTSFESWSAIVPPVGDEGLAPRRLDWWRFRAEGFNTLVLNTAKAIRKGDAKRIVFYDTLLFDDPTTTKELRSLDCSLANGGTSNYSAIANRIQGGLYGLQERCEEVSVGHWSALSPTQLDLSLFIMTMGGGGNTHCKMFIDGTMNFADLRKPTWSLDRYEKFMPIWTELRRTAAMPFDCYLYQNMGATLLQENNLGGACVARDNQALIDCMENHLSFGVGPEEFWSQGRMLMVMTRELGSLEQDAMDPILRYAANGGVVVMTASAGAKNTDAPAKGSLLEQFGFSAPPAAADKGFAQAMPVNGDVFPQGAKSFLLQDAFAVPPPTSATTVAFFDGDPQRAAITWKPFGKGKVVVVWANGLVAPSRTKTGRSSSVEQAEPLLHDLAQWCGVRTYADVSAPNLWAHVLKDRLAETYYGLVYNSSYNVASPAALSGEIRFPQLPGGRYDVSEMISGQKLGAFRGSDLAGKGIPVKLDPEVVAIYRIKKSD